MKPDQYYTDVIARPMTGIRGIHGKVANEKPRHEIEITAEDEQQFLLRQQQYLQQGAQPGMVPVGGVPGGSMGAGIPKTPDRKSMGSPGVQGSPTKKVILKIKSITSNQIFSRNVIELSNKLFYYTKIKLHCYKKSISKSIKSSFDGLVHHK